MQSNLTTEEKELLIKGLDALDNPSYNEYIRRKARKLRTKLKNSITTRSGIKRAGPYPGNYGGRDYKPER